MTVVALSVGSVLALRFLPPITSAFILRERVTGDTDVTHTWESLAEISEHLGLAVVASEDQTFPDHHGFDFAQIQDALSEEDRRRGASTITQQVAKNLYLWPGGGLLRKGIEAYLTVLIEVFWPKRRILEVYLNVAEFGPGVFGAGAAARIYFGKEPLLLSRREAAMMATVLPSPKRMLLARPSAYVRRRAAEIERQMDALGESHLRGLWPDRD